MLQKHDKQATKPATHQQTRSQQVGTSAQNTRNDNNLEVPKYRIIGSAIITHFDLGKKAIERIRVQGRKEHIL